MFKRYDDDGSRWLSKEEFMTGVGDTQAGMSDTEISDLYNLFDRNNDGCVHYEEFLSCIRVRNMLLSLYILLLRCRKGVSLGL